MDVNTSGLKKISVASVALGAVVVVWGAICGVTVGFDDARPFFVLLSGVAGALDGSLMARSRLYAHRHLHRAWGSFSCAPCSYCRKPRRLGVP